MKPFFIFLYHSSIGKVARLCQSKRTYSDKNKKAPSKLPPISPARDPHLETMKHR